MWRRAVKGTVVAELAGITVADAAPGSSDPIAQFVCEAIEAQPWTSRHPLKTLAIFVAMVSIVLSLSNLDGASARSRLRVLRVLRFVPAFSMFRKYVRALAMLALFDAPGVEFQTSSNAGAD
jgi:hypothetical protein